MKKSQHSSAGPEKKSGLDNKPVEHKANDTDKDDCRCKEVSKKTPMELLKLMINDLAIWKK
ncbi:MAG: hypothetical protein HQL08_04120 [Nitrospirae bacterium]|nr:hypothetical protein [Nitrospirota bacterium]